MQVCIKTGWTDGRPKTFEVNTNARWSRLGLFPEPRMIGMYSCLQNGCYWTGTLCTGCLHQSNTTASWCEKASTEKNPISFIVADWRSDVPKAKNEIHFESLVGAFLILVSRPQTEVISGMESDGQSHAFQFLNRCKSDTSEFDLTFCNFSYLVITDGGGHHRRADTKYNLYHKFR